MMAQESESENCHTLLSLCFIGESKLQGHNRLKEKGNGLYPLKILQGHILLCVQERRGII